jgi:hypothetical protein
MPVRNRRRLLYERWHKMHWRVKHLPAYKEVSVDERWSTFQGFLDNQPPGRSYELGLCLCRWSDEGDYTPENTRWATRSENTREAIAAGRIHPPPPGPHRRPRDAGDEVIAILTAALERGD